MVQSECRLLRGLLGFICLLAMCISASPDLCVSLRTVKEDLNVTSRRRYMKMNFPINYTIQVHYEEVFRLRNISQLLSEEDRPELSDLRVLWIHTSKEGIKKVLKVLPERHPTRRKYLSNLEDLFRDFEGLYYQKYKKDETRELPESIQNILENTEKNGWRSVTPKSILDNCYRTMLCLFKECFKNENDNINYCDPNWRKGNQTT